MSQVIFERNGLTVSSFFGGADRGKCLQFDGDVAQLDRGAVLRLVTELAVWAAGPIEYRAPVADAAAALSCKVCGQTFVEWEDLKYHTIDHTD